MLTTWGMASVAHPAANAEATPVRESSMATQDAASTLSARAPARYGSGCGLPWVTSSPVIVVSKRILWSRYQDCVGEPAPRHRYEHTRNRRVSARCKQLKGSGSPRQLTLHAFDNAVHQPVDQCHWFHFDASSPQRRCSVKQIRADQRSCIRLGPSATEFVDEFVLALNPVRLGVDQRAVHVPQHRCQFSHSGKARAGVATQPPEDGDLVLADLARRSGSSMP